MDVASVLHGAHSLPSVDLRAVAQCTSLAQVREALLPLARGSAPPAGCRRPRRAAYGSSVTTHCVSGLHHGISESPWCRRRPRRAWLGWRCRIVARSRRREARRAWRVAARPDTHDSPQLRMHDMIPFVSVPIRCSVAQPRPLVRREGRWRAGRRTR